MTYINERILKLCFRDDLRYLAGSDLSLPGSVSASRHLCGHID